MMRRQAGPGARGSVAGATIKYAERGRRFEEAVIVFVAGHAGQEVTGEPNYATSAELILMFRTPEGQMTRQERFFHTMFGSLRSNPVWDNAVFQLRNAITQNALKEAGNRSQILARAMREVSDIQQQTWDNVQRTNDAGVEDFNRMMREVDLFVDPGAGNSLEFGHEWDYVWSNGSNEAFGTNDPDWQVNMPGYTRFVKKRWVWLLRPAPPGC